VNAKPGFLAEAVKRIVRREGAADSLIHHGQAVVRERLIVHGTTSRKSRRLCPSGGSFVKHERPQKGPDQIGPEWLIRGYRLDQNPGRRPETAGAPRELSLFRVLWVEGGAQRPLWLYHRAYGDRAPRSVLSRASTVRRSSWQAAHEAVADLLPGDKHLLSEAQVPQTARPPRGSTAAARPQPAP
jgi:hypothetical protein